MSLCTIYTNIDRFKHYLKEIEEVVNENKDDEHKIIDFVISNCCEKQYLLRRNYYNKNMLKKHRFNSDIKSYEYLDYMYQHIYSHNHIALEDEVYEVFDALDKYLNIFKNSKDNHIDVENVIASNMLILEEIIDVCFFIFELTDTIEEHYHLILEANKENSDINKHQNYYYDGINEFSKSVLKMIREEAKHISTEIMDLKIKDGENTNLNIEDNLYNILRLNRDFIRQTNFKDWREYPEDYYNQFKFGNLFMKNREMYKFMFSIVKNYLARGEVAPVFKDLDIMIDKMNDTFAVYKLIYAGFMTKWEVNEYRQLKDKNYKLNNTGDSIGVEVK